MVEEEASISEVAILTFQNGKFKEMAYNSPAERKEVDYYIWEKKEFRYLKSSDPDGKRRLSVMVPTRSALPLPATLPIMAQALQSLIEDGVNVEIVTNDGGHLAIIQFNTVEQRAKAQMYFEEVGKEEPEEEKNQSFTVGQEHLLAKFLLYKCECGTYSFNK